MNYYNDFYMFNYNLGNYGEVLNIFSVGILHKFWQNSKHQIFIKTI